MKRRIVYGNVHMAHSKIYLTTLIDRACYLAVPFFVCGFIVIGASFQKHLSLGAVIMGWGIAEFSIMINTVAVYAYLNDAFPRHQGEVSALINLARVLGGMFKCQFSVSAFLNSRKRICCPILSSSMGRQEGCTRDIRR